jgi:hypothetical protein
MLMTMNVRRYLHSAKRSVFPSMRDMPGHRAQIIELQFLNTVPQLRPILPLRAHTFPTTLKGTEA